MLEVVYNKLEPEAVPEKVSAATRKQENEISCPLYKEVSYDELKHIFEYVGEGQYVFVVCTSYRFHQVYLETFGYKTSTTFRNATVSVSCAKLCLAATTTERPKAAQCLLFNTAARDGKLNILKWGTDSGYDLKNVLNARTIANAAFNGHLEVVQYLRTLGISRNAGTCAHAAYNGYLVLLKWTRANDCPWDERICSCAAQNCHLQTLKWARVNQCPWDERTCARAAENGHLELLKWARANQCPWNESTCAYAARNGHLELLKWAKSNQCPWDEVSYVRLCCHGWSP